MATRRVRARTWRTLQERVWAARRTERAIACVGSLSKYDLRVLAGESSSFFWSSAWRYAQRIVERGEEPREIADDQVLWGVVHAAVIDDLVDVPSAALSEQLVEVGAVAREGVPVELEERSVHADHDVPAREVEVGGLVLGFEDHSVLVLVLVGGASRSLVRSRRGGLGCGEGLLSPLS